MATAPIEITLPGLTGFTLTLDLYPHGSDTAAATGLTLTEATNRKCTYTTTTAAGLTGIHLAIAKEGSTVRGEGYVLMDDTTNNHVVTNHPAIGTVEADEVELVLMSDNLDDTAVAKIGTVTAVASVAASPAPTTTSFRVTYAVVPLTGSPATGGLNDQPIRFTSGTLTGQMRPILTYTYVDAFNADVTLEEALTGAPTAGDAVAIHAQHVHPVSQIQAGLATQSSLTTLVNRIGAFTGSGVNTVLGFLQAIMRSDATTPSDVGGDYDDATDSLEAIADAAGDGGGPNIVTETTIIESH